MAVKRENSIERELRERVEAIGGACIKTAAIGRRGFFDRVVVLPSPDLPRIIFVECKKPRGGVVSQHQKQWHAKFKELGVAVALIKNSADIDALLRR